MIKKVVIDVIPHEEQRYDTVGDYTFDDENQVLHIKVSDTDNPKEALAVAIHELVEFVLVQEHGVSLKDIDEFDIAWEAGERRCYHNCTCDDDREPGSCYKAPYWIEHRAATKVEKVVVKNWGMDWDEYDDHLYELNESRKPK